MKPYSRVYAQIDLDALVSNMKAMKEALPGDTSFMGVVKADGYGHGAVPVAWAIDPYVEGFAVASLEEGILLRRHGIKKEILVLGVTHPSGYEELLEFDITPTIFQYERAKQLSDLAVKKGKKVPVHLAVDTGMGRIGVKPDRESAKMAAEMNALPGIFLEGVFTHFARADETEKAFYEKQYQEYTQFLEYLKENGVVIPHHHCSNSAGIIEGLSSNDCGIVRAGIAIYGLYPSDEVDHETIKLTPAMSLKSYLAYVKEMEPGMPISYGSIFVTDRPMRVGTVPVGYADGYSRNLSNKGYVLICGKPAKILGRICMDQCMVDITDIPEAKEGDTVTLLGRDGHEEITAEKLAELSGGYHYEILCNIGKRVPRVYLRNGQIAGVKDYFDDHYEPLSGS